MSMVRAEFVLPPPEGCEIRANCPLGQCGITHYHWTREAFRALRELCLTFRKEMT